MNHTDLVLTTKALYEWVAEQKDSQKEWINETCQCEGCRIMRTKRDIYHGVIQKMRTLFAGLIDFEEQKE